MLPLYYPHLHINMETCESCVGLGATVMRNIAHREILFIYTSGGGERDAPPMGAPTFRMLVIYCGSILRMRKVSTLCIQIIYIFTTIMSTLCIQIIYILTMWQCPDVVPGLQ